MRRTTQEGVIFDSLSSTNQRLMREMEEFLSSVDTSDAQVPVKSAAVRPRPQSIPDWMQQSRDCGVIFERSAEDCDNETSEPYLQEINDEQSTEDHDDDDDDDDFDIRIQRMDDAIDQVLNNLQSHAQGGKPAEYEYYNDPKYQRHRDRSIDDDSLVAMAKRLDDASIISDPSVICGANEKFPLLTAAARRYKMQGYNRKKSAKNTVQETSRSDRAARQSHSRRSSSNTSSTSSSSSHPPRDEEVSSSDSTRYKTEENVLKATPAAAAEKETTARVFDNKPQYSIPRSHFKDGDKRTYKNRSVDERRKENHRQPRPSSKSAPSPSEHRKKSSSSKEAPHQQDDLKSRSKRDSEPADNRYAQAIPPPIRACYSDFRSGSSQDYDTNDGEDSDHTEFFYESTDDDDDDGGSEDDIDEDEFNPRVVGSSVSVTDAVTELNNQRPLKRVMNLFGGKKSKGEEDIWSVMTQRESE